MNSRRAPAILALLMLCFSRLVLAGPANVIIDLKNEYIIGAATSGKWLDSAHAAESLKPGSSFRVYGLTSFCRKLSDRHTHLFR